MSDPRYTASSSDLIGPMRGEKENRKTKRGIRKGGLRANVAHKPKHRSRGGFSPASEPKKIGRNLRRSRRKLYKRT